MSPFFLNPQIRSLVWPVCSVVCAALVLLLGFGQVVSASVRSAQARQAAQALQAQAAWRCKALRAGVARDECLPRAQVVSYSPRQRQGTD